MFYAYWAIVHVQKMLSLSGLNWQSAPSKWQALDLIHLILDVVVVTGLVLRWKVCLAGNYYYWINAIAPPGVAWGCKKLRPNEANV